MISAEAEIRNGIIRLNALGDTLNELRRAGIGSKAHGLVSMAFTQLDAARQCFERAAGRGRIEQANRGPLRGAGKDQQ